MRRFHVLTFLLAGAHNAFELGAGVGLVFQPELGLRGAGAAWGAVIPASIAVAARGSRRWDPVLAFGVGMNLAAVVVHFTLWPWEVRGAIPRLVEAEGMTPRQLPAYNAILLAWGAAGLLASLREVPRGHRRWVVAGVAAALPLRSHARRQFRWIREQARRNPAWWNRAVGASAGEVGTRW